MSGMDVMGPRACRVVSPGGMPVDRRVAAGDEVLQLTLDIGQERARAEPEQVWAKPTVAQLVLPQGEPVQRVSRRADAACGLESHEHAGPLPVLAYRACHHQAHRERGVHALLAGGRLDEV